MKIRRHEATPEAAALDRAVLGWMQELAPHGVLVTDKDLRVRRWNLWLETHSGVKRDLLLGRHLFEAFPDLSKRRMDRYFQEALAGQISLLSAGLHGYLLPFPSTVRESGFLNMRQTARIAPLVESGKVVGTITTIEDVTQREFQNLRASRQHERQELLSWTLGQLIEAPDPERMVKNIFPRISAHIFVDAFLNHLLEADGRLRLHSAGGLQGGTLDRVRVLSTDEAMCGTRPEQARPVVLSRIQDSKEPRARFPKELGLRAYVCNPLIVGERLIGSLAFASRTRDRFTDDEVAFTTIVAQYVAIAIDRARSETALRKAQEDLRTHAESLEQKVQERTHKLRETIAELESFSYSLAHDVRAPLRHIQGFAEVLMEDFEDQLPAPARKHVDAINRAIVRLDRLTRDILEYSRVSSKPVHLVPVDLEKLLEGVIATMGREARGIIEVQSPLHPVKAEPSFLHQCLANLLDNALKFVHRHVSPRIVIRTELMPDRGPRETRTPPAGGPAPLNPVPRIAPESQVLTAPAVRRRNEGWVRIWVEDNGIGIPPEFHQKIFGIFERLSYQQEGTGIGLAIVSKSVARMGGHFGLESESGKGSRFWIELPAVD